MDYYCCTENNVCRIETSRGGATGFLYGNGWVVTNSHVLRTVDEVDGAHFTFVDGRNAHGKDAQCIVIRLPSEAKVDYSIPDLVLVHLDVRGGGFAKLHDKFPTRGTKLSVLHVRA